MNSLTTELGNSKIRTGHDGWAMTTRTIDLVKNDGAGLNVRIIYISPGRHSQGS